MISVPIRSQQLNFNFFRLASLAFNFNMNVPLKNTYTIRICVLFIHLYLSSLEFKTVTLLLFHNILVHVPIIIA